MKHSLSEISSAETQSHFSSSVWFLKWKHFFKETSSSLPRPKSMIEMQPAVSRPKINREMGQFHRFSSQAQDLRVTLNTENFSRKGWIWWKLQWCREEWVLHLSLALWLQRLLFGPLEILGAQELVDPQLLFRVIHVRMWKFSLTFKAAIWSPNRKLQKE